MNERSRETVDTVVVEFTRAEIASGADATVATLLSEGYELVSIFTEGTGLNMVVVATYSRRT